MKTGRRLLRQLKKGECQYVALSQEGGPAASEPVLHSLWVDCPRGPRLEVRGPAHGGRLRGRPRQHTACRLGYELLQNIPLEMEKTSAASFSTISAEGITRGPRSLPTQARAASSTGARQGTVFGPRPALGTCPLRHRGIGPGGPADSGAPGEACGLRPVPRLPAAAPCSSFAVTVPCSDFMVRSTSDYVY